MSYHLKKENAIGFNLATGQTVTEDEELKPDLGIQETAQLMKLYYLTEEIEIDLNIKKYINKIHKSLL